MQPKDVSRVLRTYADFDTSEDMITELLEAHTDNEDLQAAYLDYYRQAKAGEFDTGSWYDPDILFSGEVWSAPFRPGTNIGALIKEGKVKFNFGINWFFLHLEFEISGKGIFIKPGVGVGVPSKGYAYVVIDENPDSERWSSRGITGGNVVGVGVEQKYTPGEDAIWESNEYTYSFGLTTPGIYVKAWEARIGWEWGD